VKDIFRNYYWQYLSIINRKFMNKKYILWDHDGVLVNSGLFLRNSIHIDVLRMIIVPVYFSVFSSDIVYPAPTA